MDMKHSTSTLCWECNETITEPLCPHCLTKHIQAYVGERRPDLALQMVNSTEAGGIEGEGETTCLCCGQGMNICAHCISSDAYQYLLEKDAALAEDFMGRFDFDLRTTFL